MQVLAIKPFGSFLLRPHETVASQFFVSFRTLSSSHNEGVIKHAIIRKTRVDDASAVPSDAIVPRFEYQCGKLGPYSSMMEMLQ
jgi:hypothetical protein